MPLAAMEASMDKEKVLLAVRDAAHAARKAGCKHEEIEQAIKEGYSPGLQRAEDALAGKDVRDAPQSWKPKK